MTPSAPAVSGWLAPVPVLLGACGVVVCAWLRNAWSYGRHSRYDAPPRWYAFQPSQEAEGAPAPVDDPEPQAEYDLETLRREYDARTGQCRTGTQGPLPRNRRRGIPS